VGQRWPNCDPSVSRFVERVEAAVREELGDELVGVYLHGSLALGSYYPPKSDIDLLLVVRRAMDPPARERLSKLFVDLSTDRPTLGDVEVSAITEHAARHFEHPLPYEIHYSTSWNERILSGDVDYAAERKDPDLAAHVTSVRESGVALYGPLPADLFAPVPEEDFLDSILDDLEWIVEGRNILESPFYGVLNGCRVLLVLADRSRLVPSKEEAALWALENVPEVHRAVIRDALGAYRSADPVSETQRQTAGRDWDEDALLSFREFLVGQVPWP
jgi:streptomycin 3"-adenylyltransferase